MDKKEKSLIVYSFTYLILLAILIILISVFAIFSLKGIGIIILLFCIFLPVGYLVLCILRMNTYIYKCPKCGNIRKMTFAEALFSRRYYDSRKLKCKNCNEKEYMERIVK